MSKIIAFSNQKGGVGKTTANLIAATALSCKPFNYDVCLIDTDLQKSALELRNDEPENTPIPYPIIAYNVNDFEQNINNLDAKHDLIFVDLAGKLDTNISPDKQEVTRILNYVDFLFIPVTSGNFVLDSTIVYLSYIFKLQQVRQSQNRPFKVVLFQNKVNNRSTNYRFLKSELSQIKDMEGVKVMDSYLKHYKAFSDIDTVTTLYDDNATNKAKLNFSVWLNEFINIIK